jgi:threonine dehydrogenase-like Zn-dependent dehydrogenase
MDLPAGHVVVKPTCVGLFSPDCGVDAASAGNGCVGVIERGEGAGKRVVVASVIACGTCERCKAGLPTHCLKRRVPGWDGSSGAIAAMMGKDELVVPASACVEAPAGLRDEHAIFANAYASVMTIASMVRVDRKPYVTVLGDGVMGLLVAQQLARASATVRLLGHHAHRYGLCERWGIKHRDAREAGLRQDQDVVIDCTGKPAGLVMASKLARPRGRVIVKTSPVCATSFDVAMGTMLANEIELTSVSAGSLASAAAALVSSRTDLEPMLTLRGRSAEVSRIMGAVRGRQALCGVVV